MMRDDSIDFIKGVAIILMVACHAGVTGCAAHFIYLFHMPVFLLASGYFFKIESTHDIGNLKRFALKRIRRLWFPFVLWTGVFTLCHNLFISLRLYEGGGGRTLGAYAKALCYVPFMCSMPTICCAMWFVSALFWVGIVYWFVCYIVGRFRMNVFWVQCAIAVCFLLFGNGVENNTVLMKFGGPRLFVCYALFHLGVAMSRLLGKVDCTLRQHCPLVLIISCVSLIGMMPFESVELVDNQYNNGMTLAMSAVLGWFMLWSLFYILEEHMFSNGLTRWVRWIGRHTMPILIFHFVVFKMITYIGIVLGCGQIAMLSKFPTAFHNWYWIVLYTVAGVALPIVVSSGWFAAVDRVQSKRVRSVL